MKEKTDRLACPECKYSSTVEGISSLGGYMETWKDNSEFLSALLRPELPSNVLLEPGLRSLYEDCYQTLLIGRYNASIVMMGVFLEALMKERIRLKTGEDFKKTYGGCIDRLRGIKRLRKGRTKQLRDGYLIEPRDIIFLDRFRDEVRNTYAHFDEPKVVDGRIMKAWKVPIKELMDPTKFKVTFEAIKSGERKPLLLHATHPALRSISKSYSDRKMAVDLFNLVYDFMLGFVMKYLRHKDYAEYNKNYPHPFVDLTPILRPKRS